VLVLRTVSREIRINTRSSLARKRWIAIVFFTLPVHRSIRSSDVGFTGCQASCSVAGDLYVKI